MTIQLKDNTLILASGNAGKLNELSHLLSPAGITVKAQSDFNTPEADETGLSFIENAILKARNAANHTGWASLADDSGLEVDAIQGAPGIYSARYAFMSGQPVEAGINKDEANNRKLLFELRGQPKAKRTARFHCALALCRFPNDPAPWVVHRTWEGEILEAPVGEGGFGYDPLFYVPTENCAAAELSKEQKGAISHRGQAMKALMDYLI